MLPTITDLGIAVGALIKVASAAGGLGFLGFIGWYWSRRGHRAQLRYLRTEEDRFFPRSWQLLRPERKLIRRQMTAMQRINQR